jgi:ADP-ribose pyrophosphatase YjhB (NUDIX family)
MMGRFNIRVYGLWINDRQEILLSDERMGDFRFTKFPGGGLEFGEGLHDGLKREWREELGVEIEILDHFYTTDFFQSSAFHTETQIISIYYLVRPLKMPEVVFSSSPFDFKTEEYQEEVFRWKSLDQLQPENVSLPIDRVVIQKMLKLP